MFQITAFCSSVHKQLSHLHQTVWEQSQTCGRTIRVLTDFENSVNMRIVRLSEVEKVRFFAVFPYWQTPQIQKSSINVIIGIIGVKTKENRIFDVTNHLNHTQSLRRTVNG